MHRDDSMGPGPAKRENLALRLHEGVDANAAQAMLHELIASKRIRAFVGRWDNEPRVLRVYGMAPGALQQVRDLVAGPDVLLEVV